MTDLAASRSQYLDLPIPSILVRRDGRPLAPPVRVPELASLTITDIRGRGDRDDRVADGMQIGWEPLDFSSDTDLDVLRLERLELESQLPDLRREHAAMRGKLARLKREIRSALLERDGLLAVAAALREHVVELTSERTEQDPEELVALQREVQELRRRNSELEGPRAGFGFPTKLLRIGSWTGRQRFDDS